MNRIERDRDGFVVDATLLESAFKLPVSKVRTLMQDGHITSSSEKGQGEDEGRWRITFYYGGRALRLTLNSDGTIKTRGTFPVPNRRRRDRR